MRSVIRSLRLAAIATCVTAPVHLHAQTTATLVVRRAAGDSVILGAAELGRLTRLEVRASEHGRAATFAGVSFQAALAAAGVRLDSLRGPALADIAIVDAADGYRVVFSLAELAADLGGRAVLLADRRDGAALAATEGPWRLVVAADGRPARWIRQVRRVSIERVH